MTAVKIKNQKAQRKVSLKRLILENYKNCLEAPQLDNKINYHAKKSEINVGSLKKDHKEFMKCNKLVLKTQQRFKGDGHNVFTEEIDKIALSSNDNKRMQTVDSTETYAYGMSKDLVTLKEEIKCSSIIKAYKNIYLRLYYKRRHKET